MGIMDPLDGAELELACPCGYENFERVIVQRKPHAPIITDFVACVGCKTMYFVPMSHGPAITGGPNVKRKWQPGDAIGGPPVYEQPRPDSDAALKRDAATAAKDYVKPGRSPKLKPGGR